MSTLFRRSASELATLARSVSVAAKRVSQTANLMCGMPDYDTYVEHMQKKHPDQPVMSYEAFFRERQEARYAAGNGRGCC